jgi:hypothetical protein
MQPLTNLGLKKISYCLVKVYNNGVQNQYANCLINSLFRGEMKLFALKVALVYGVISIVCLYNITKYVFRRVNVRKLYQRCAQRI